MATTEEAAFTAANVEAHEKQTLIKQAEFWLKMHDVYERAAKVFVDIKNWMAHWPDRGPRDHEEEDRESIRDLVRKTVRATVEIQGDYHEGGDKGSSPQWRNWVMTLLGTLVAIGITSLVVMYANQKAMAERMDGFERRIANIEHKIWP